ncbi:MAG: [FeFe] hydrogenase H-cluster radical SAM maturase HydG, partial [Bacteroidetes bacterium HGW-Bacteroidetes-22]
MKFNPEKCRIKDERMQPFIDAAEIWDLLHNTVPDRQKVKDIIARSLDKNRLTLAETAMLINATDTDLVEEIKEGARE